MMTIHVHCLTDNSKFEVKAEEGLTIRQFKEVLLQTPSLAWLSKLKVPVHILNLSVNEGRVLADEQMLDGYGSESWHPILLTLEAPEPIIPCTVCGQPFGSRRRNREGEREWKDGIPVQMNGCGHAVCMACWRESVLREEEAMEEEKEWLRTDPSLLSKEAVEEQNRVALEKAAEKARRKREREKAENLWRCVCPVAGCGQRSYGERRADDAWPDHKAMQKLVHVKQQEWKAALRSQSKCSVKSCGVPAQFVCDDCGSGVRFCGQHCILHHPEDGLFADHQPFYQASAANKDVLEGPFCCYCGVAGGELDERSCLGGSAHCSHGDELKRVGIQTELIEKLSAIKSLSQVAQNFVFRLKATLEQIQEHRVTGVERIREEFDNLISRLEARKEDMVNELRRRYREKEMELVDMMEALGLVLGELEAEQVLASVISSGQCSLRDVVDMNVMQQMVSQLASEASQESLERFSEICIKFESYEAQENVAKEFCQICELVSNRAMPVPSNLSMKQKCQEENRVAVLSRELHVTTTALINSTAREAAVRADRDRYAQEITVLKAQLTGVKTANNKQTTTAESNSTVKIQAKSSQSTPQRFLINNQESLLEAARIGSLEEVEYFVRNGVNVNCKNSSNGCTSLHYAARNGHLEVVKFLLLQGADIHCKDDDHGSTPLHLSALEGRLEVVKYLLQQGADKTIKNNYGWTPYDNDMDGSEDVKEMLR